MEAQAMYVQDDRRQPRTTVLTSAVLGTLAAWFAIVLLFVFRRIVGALVEPLSDGVLILVGVVVVAVAVIVRRNWSSLVDCNIDDAWLDRLFWLPSLLLVAMGLLVCIPGTPQSGGAVLWGLIVLEELWALRVIHSRRQGRPDHSVARNRLDRLELDSPGNPSDVPAGRDDLRVDPPQQPAPHIPLPRGSAPDVWQQTTRWRAGGEETVQGVAQAHFAPGARVAVVHIGFCPPLAAVPEVFVEPGEGVAATVRVTARHAHGVRLEAKLRAASDEPVSLLVEFTARCPLAARETTTAGISATSPSRSVPPAARTWA